jgi:hypothetical protein
MGVIADIMNIDNHQSALAGALENAAFKIWGKNFWQQGKDLELHSSDSSIINWSAPPHII